MRPLDLVGIALGAYVLSVGVRGLVRGEVRTRTGLWRRSDQREAPIYWMLVCGLLFLGLVVGMIGLTGALGLIPPTGP